MYDDKYSNSDTADKLSDELDELVTFAKNSTEMGENQISDE